MYLFTIQVGIVEFKIGNMMFKSSSITKKIFIALCTVYTPTIL